MVLIVCNGHRNWIELMNYLCLAFELGHTAKTSRAPRMFRVENTLSPTSPIMHVSHIPIYKPYGCVPLMLKGKGFSVLVAHPHPAPHRVPPPPRHPPDAGAVILGLQHQPDDVTYTVKKYYINNVP